MKKIATTSRRSGYLAVRESIGNFVEAIEYYSARFFGENSNPIALTGAMMIALVLISVVTGLFMLLYYQPLPGQAVASVNQITQDARFGSIVRAVHRTSADFIIILLVIHMVRVWARGRYKGPRLHSWLTGLLALPLIGILGWAGYVLPWDDRAMVMLAWGREIAHGVDSWPIIGWFDLGSLVTMPVFAVMSESDQLLRIFSLHIGGAFLVAALIFWHLRRVTPPRIRLPFVVWIGLVLVLLLVAAMMPVETEELRSLNPFELPAVVHIDILVTFPLLFFPALGGAWTVFFILLILALLAWLPRLEPEKLRTAAVSDIKCAGCRLCLNDCPYGAIEMVPHPNPVKRRKGREIALVLSGYCAACGICVGSCIFDAIELPDMTSDEIESRIDDIGGIREIPEPEILPDESLL